MLVFVRTNAIVSTEELSYYYYCPSELSVSCVFISHVRRQRMLEVREAQKKACYGDVLEISREDYVREVNQAGDGIWAVVHVYKNGSVESVRQCVISFMQPFFS